MQESPIGCRVLIVEDEWFLASDLQAALRSAGADVIALVGDVADAHAQVALGGFDVGVIDINLRGHDAFGIADELQRQGKPFLFFTGYSADLIPKRFAKVSRVEKPFNSRELAECVLQLWHRRSEADAKSPSSC